MQQDTGVSAKPDRQYRDCLMKLELPLLDNSNSSLGTLWLVKDLRREFVNHLTLRRVEHLRRSVVGTLQKLSAPR